MHYFLSILTLIYLGETPTYVSQIQGTWLSSDQEVKLEIYKRGEKLYGKIIWFKTGKDTGKFPYDEKNPNPKLRNRKIVGLEILQGFQYDGRSKKWKHGSIYHPQYGKVFKGSMWLDGSDNLKIRAYWGLIYRTNTWQRIN